MNKQRIFIYWSIILILMILCFVSCSVPKKLERLHKRYPELFENKIDSVKQDIHFTLDGVQLKKQFTIDEIKHDPLIFREKHLSVQTFYDTMTQIMYLDAKCDTVRIDSTIYVKYPVYEYIEAEKGFFGDVKFWQIALWLIIIFAIYMLFK